MSKFHFSSKQIGDFPIHQHRGSQPFIDLLDAVPLGIFKPLSTTRYAKYVFLTHLALYSNTLPIKIKVITFAKVLLYGWQSDLSSEERRILSFEDACDFIDFPDTYVDLFHRDIVSFETQFFANFPPETREKLVTLLTFFRALADYPIFEQSH